MKQKINRLIKDFQAIKKEASEIWTEISMNLGEILRIFLAIPFCLLIGMAMGSLVSVVMIPFFPILPFSLEKYYFIGRTLNDSCTSIGGMLGGLCGLLVVAHTIGQIIQNRTIKENENANFYL